MMVFLTPMITAREFPIVQALDAVTILLVVTYGVPVRMTQSVGPIASSGYGVIICKLIVIQTTWERSVTTAPTTATSLTGKLFLVLFFNPFFQNRTRNTWEYQKAIER